MSSKPESPQPGPGPPLKPNKSSERKAKKEKEKVEYCPICADPYTKKFRRKLDCGECKQECCLRCFQTYLMDNPMQCMYPDCNKQLDAIEIRKIVENNAFCKRLDDALAVRMLEEEKTRLPFYQPIAQIEMEKKKYQRRHSERGITKSNIKNNIRTLDMDLSTLKYNIGSIIAINKGDETKEFVLEKESFLEASYRHHHKIADHKMEIRKINMEDEMDRISVGFVKKERQQYTFIKQCAHSGCNGFLERSWMCALCDKHTCSKCHEPKKKRSDDEHICNEDTVANVEALRNW